VVPRVKFKVSRPLSTALLPLFLIVTQVKYLVVEGLALVPREQFDLAMIVVQSDPKIPFVANLDEGM
jgi:hypothetical protein